MKYTCTVDINAPIDRVVALWSNEDNFSKWQDGFQRIELLEGVANTEGAMSKISLQVGRRDMELIETILVANLPHEKKGLYEHIHMTNTQSSRFEALTTEDTRYTSEVEYTEFNGFMARLVSKLFPGMFKKQSQKWMDQFKKFVESE